MKVTIIGAGNTGLAAACHMTSQGISVTVYTRHKDLQALWNEQGITAEGVLSGHYPLSVTTDLEEASAATDLFLFTTLAYQHKEAAQMLLPFLRAGQILLFYNGCWGALQAYAACSGSQILPELTIAETANMPYIAQLSPRRDSVLVKGIKNSLSYASIGKKSGALQAFLSSLFPHVVQAPSILYTSLGSTNPIIHAAGSLFNITRIDNGEDFLFFGPAMTRRCVASMEAADRERLAVGQALGAQLPSLLDTLNSFWPEKKSTLYEALTENPSYKKSKGPASLDYRYLAEDLPCGIGPIFDLGKKSGVPTPAIAALLGAASLYLGRPYHPFLSPAEMDILTAWEKAMPHR